VFFPIPRADLSSRFSPPRVLHTSLTIILTGFYCLVSSSEVVVVTKHDRRTGMHIAVGDNLVQRLRLKEKDRVHDGVQMLWT
jgi:hypothetical protein